MNNSAKASVIACVVSVCACCLVGTRPAQAELLDIGAVVDSTAVQYISDLATLVDRETIEVGPGETGTAIASVEDAGTQPGPLRGTATAGMYFRDPFNPGPPGEFLTEFGGEVMAATRDEFIDQQVTGDVFETRSIQITPEEAGVRAGSPAAVSGEMYMHGAALVWWDSELVDSGQVESLEALIGFEIDLQKSGQEPLFVAAGSIAIRGAAGGQITVQAQEAISPDNVQAMDLSADFPELGTVWLVMYPHLLMPYVYEATVGEPYTLAGTLRLKGTTIPTGSGLGISAGGPFMELAQMLNDFYGGDVGDRLQDRIAQELGQFPLPDVPVLDIGQITQTCGASGAEVAGLVSIVGLMSLTSGGRRLSRRRTR